MMCLTFNDLKKMNKQTSVGEMSQQLSTLAVNNCFTK